MPDNQVTIFEVAARDGLQSIGRFIASEQKIALIDAISACGFSKVEVTSFVNPKRVPQMRDAVVVMAGITRNPKTTYAALTPNTTGLEAAIAAGAGEVAIFTSASEGFCRANIGCSIEDSFGRFTTVVQKARKIGLPVRGYLSSVIKCPYDGETDPRQVARIADELIQLGCYEVSLGDTIGAGSALSVDALLDHVLDKVPQQKLAGHFHDTNGTALEMAEVALRRGLRTFDGSIAGIGGCPYAPGAPGNVDTAKLQGRVTEMGFDTGLNADALARAESLARQIVQ